MDVNFAPDARPEVAAQPEAEDEVLTSTLAHLRLLATELLAADITTSTLPVVLDVSARIGRLSLAVVAFSWRHVSKSDRC